MAGGGGKRAVPILVPRQMNERIVHCDDQLEATPEGDLAHVGGQERDVRRSGKPAAGDGDQLRSEIERHHPCGGAGEERRSPSGAGSKLQDVAIRRIPGGPGPKLRIATVGQLLLEERQDAVVVGADCVVGASALIRGNRRTVHDEYSVSLKRYPNWRDS